MGLFESVFGISPGEPLGIVIWLAILAFLLGLVFFAWRANTTPRFASARRGKQARLAVSDATVVSERRRLVLVRRDDVEHLILIGGPNDLVVESNIIRTAPARPLAKPEASAPAMAPSTPAPGEAASKPVEIAAKTQTSAPMTAERPAPARPTPMPERPQVSPPPAPQALTPAAPVRPAAPARPPAPAVDQPRAAPVTPERVSVSRAEETRSMVDEMDALLDEITPPQR